MFERYTEKARRVIFFARYEASQYGSPFIEPQHMLFGLMREDGQLFARLFPAGPGIDALREALQRNMQKNAATSTSLDLPVSSFVIRSFSFAAEESERCGAKLIDTTQLLLGLLREESAVSEVFGQYGITLAAVREKVVHQITTPSGNSAEILAALRFEFAPLVKRLTSEIEPATMFSFRGSWKDRSS